MQDKPMKPQSKPMGMHDPKMAQMPNTPRSGQREMVKTDKKHGAYKVKHGK